MHRLLLSAFLLAACNFDSSTNAGTDPDSLIDADPAAPDADPNAPDADPNAPDASPDLTCGWGYTPAHFNPCVDPPGTLNPLDLSMTNDPQEEEPPYIFDTTDTPSTLLDPQTNSIPHTSTVVGGIRILWTSSFNLGTGANLRVIGDKPLLIVSKTSINISGSISVASFNRGAASNLRIGAGSEPAACMTTPSQKGEDCEHGGGGGGGGGFGGAGGQGGGGAGENTGCIDEFGDGVLLGATGGTGGLMVALPTTLRGGCAGKEGGDGNGGTTSGPGGGGGGAIQLTALTTLSISGRIHAGGAGGHESDGSRAAGGGGGSGGMIGLEAASIDVVSGARISANGGGGGGGGNGAGDEGAFDGDDAPPNGNQALGGAATDGDGTAGGAGGWRDALDGASVGITTKRGGGGGGGGAGYILTYQDSTPSFSNATISPAAIAVP